MDWQKRTHAVTGLWAEVIDDDVYYAAERTPQTTLQEAAASYAAFAPDKRPRQRPLVFYENNASTSQMAMVDLPSGALNTEEG